MHAVIPSVSSRGSPTVSGTALVSEDEMVTDILVTV